MTVDLLTLDAQPSPTRGITARGTGTRRRPRGCRPAGRTRDDHAVTQVRFTVVADGLELDHHARANTHAVPRPKSDPVVQDDDPAGHVDEAPIAHEHHV